MSAFELAASEIREGVWHGVVTGGSGVPQIEVRHRDRAVDGVSLDEAGDSWNVAVPIPPEAIADGVQTFVVYDRVAGRKLADFTLIAGEALGEDLRAEVELLRAELDMLKRAFRRHCAESG